MSVNDRGRHCNGNKVVKLNNHVAMTSVGSKATAVILSSELATDRGINLNPEVSSFCQLVTRNTQDYDDLPSSSPSSNSADNNNNNNNNNNGDEKNNSYNFACDIFLIVCGEQDYNLISTSPSSHPSSLKSDSEEEITRTSSSSPSSNNRNNLSVFSFRRQDSAEVFEDDVAKVISDVCPKALLVVDSTADSHSQLNAVSGACLDCNLFFLNSQQQREEDAFTNHMITVHGGVMVDVIERRRQQQQQQQTELSFAAFFTPKSSSSAPQFIEALPWQHLSVVMPQPPTLEITSHHHRHHQLNVKPQQQQRVKSEKSSPMEIDDVSSFSSASSKQQAMKQQPHILPNPSPSPSPLFPAGATTITTPRTHSTPVVCSSNNNPNAGTTRCISKTLKCPRCNWHYKYQETLEIHMREKHPDADSSQCIYCATKREHPRLSRGENYSCGYKPYRCEICNYATTTKGNLSIHMQSDKHLHNVQEFAASQGADARPTPSAAALEASTLAAAASFHQQQQQQAVQRLQANKSNSDLHNNNNNDFNSSSTSLPSSGSKTSLSANKNNSASKSTDRSKQPTLPTSPASGGGKSIAKVADKPLEKAAAISLSSFPDTVSAAATLASLAAASTSSSSSHHHHHQAPTAASLLTTPTSTSLSDVSLESIMQQYALCRDLVLSSDFQQQTGCDSSATSLLLQQLAVAALSATAPSTASTSLNGGQSSSSTAQTSHHHQQTATKSKQHSSSSSNLVHQSSSKAANTTPTSSGSSNKLFECLLCDNFATDSLLDLKAHMDFDRTLNPPIHDFDPRILAMVDNYYYCKLCSYKTPLKANFQVHSKTEKHLQKFQMLLHILEGGVKSEAKLANFPNVVSSVRCVACDFPAASAHRLEQHALSIGHELFCKLASDVTQLGRDVKFHYVCRLCSSAGNTDNSFLSKSQLSRHLASPEHMRQETFFQAQRTTSELTTGGLTTGVSEVDLRQLIEVEPISGGGSGRTVSPASSSFVSSTAEADNSSPLSAMPSRFGSTLAAGALLSASGNSKTAIVTCPICQMSFDSHAVRVQHLTDVHSVPKANVPRLLELMALVDGTTTTTTTSTPPPPSVLSALPLDNSSANSSDVAKNLKRPLSPPSREPTDGSRLTASPMDLSVPKKQKVSSSSKPHLVKDEPKPVPLNLTTATDALAAMTSQINYEQMIQSLLSTAFPQSLFPAQTSASLPATAAITQLASVAAAQQQQQQSSASSSSSSNDEQFRCHSCTRLFATVDNLFNHLAESQHLNSNTATVKGPGLLCWKKGCNQYFKSVHTLKMHFRQIHNVPLPDFILDSGTASNKTSSSNHQQQSSTTGRSSSSGPQKSSSSQFRCSHCSLSFESAAALESHGKLHLANMAGFNCAVCGAWQETFYDYTEHLNSHRLNLNTNTDKLATANTFKCDACNVSFPDIDLFRGHCHSVAHKINSAENGLVASSSSSLLSGSGNVAMKKSSSKTSVSQQSTAANDVDSNALLTGVYGATPSGSYTCDICEISFARQTYLQQHLLSPYHQRSVKRLQDTLMERGRMSILDTLQQAYQSTFQLSATTAATTNPLLGGLDLATAAAALNPLLANQLLAGLGATAFPSTPAALWSAAFQPPPVQLPTTPSTSALLQSATHLQQQQQQLQASQKKSPSKSPHQQQLPLAASTPLSADRKSKCSARILKMLENVGGDVVKSRLVALTANNNNNSEAAGSDSACNVSSSSSSCSTCSTLQDLDDPMPLMEHRETSHGLSITAKDVEEVIRNRPEVFGQKVGDEFKAAVQMATPEEGEKSMSSAPEQTATVQASPPKQPKQQKTEPVQPAQIPSTTASNQTIDLLSQLDPLLSFCAVAGLLDPLTAASTASALLAAQQPQIPPSSANLPTLPVPKSATTTTTTPTPGESSSKIASSSSAIDSGRTRITDEQRAVFREYFNINNLPSDAEIEEICRRTNLGRKVVKHWFRNTLFKERQRNQNSPYNLNIPPPSSTTPPPCDDIPNNNNNNNTSDPGQTMEVDNKDQQLEKEQEELEHLEQQPKLADEQLSTNNNDDYDQNDDYEEEIEQPRSYGAQQDGRLSPDAMSRSGSPNETTSRSNGNSWRRASRTKFSDHQLQSLMEAFERNAYPREEDQKRLSQQLGLSQRVIIVWFQNQRQKTRRSSQGSVLSVASVSSGRGSNDNNNGDRPGVEQTATSVTHLVPPDVVVSVDSNGGDDSNHGESDEEDVVEEDVEEDDPRLMICDVAGATTHGNTSGNSNGGNNKRIRTTITAQQHDIMYESFQRCQNPTRDQLESLCLETGLTRRTVQVWFQNQRSRERKSGINRPELASLLAPHNSFQQFDFGGSRNGQNSSLNEINDDSISSVNGGSEDNDDDMAVENSNSCNSSLFNNGTGVVGSNNNRRRFRTQLSQLQIRIMRSIFEHYKTPTQAECIQLGKELGLQKSVVQVWYQNARAKEKKAKLGFVIGVASSETEHKTMSSEVCIECNEPMSGSFVEHLLSKGHIEALKVKYSRIVGSGGDASSSADDADQIITQPNAQKYSSSPESEPASNNNNNNDLLPPPSAHHHHSTSPALLTSNVQ